VKIYMVGGAVRDALLDLAVKDRDYVVVGATPQQMQALGYRPVGKDFPVFLHPQTHAEYALARTERKTAPGYRGFVFHAAPDVTLEQDLVRRDLTINAIAQAEDGTLIDPFGGVRDIEQRIFRHVSSAFGEDPVRILRVARFAARFADFTLAPETLALMRRMVEEGEVDALVPERVWQELARGLMEAKPSRMLALLRECGALARILPELDALWCGGSATVAPQDGGGRMLQAIDRASAHGVDLALRFASLMHDPQSTPDAGDPDAGQRLIAKACQRLRVPNDCRDLAIMVAREQRHLAGMQDPDAAVTLFERCDAFRKPQRFGQLLQACASDDPACAAIAWWPAALAAARGVDAGHIAQSLAQSSAPGLATSPQAIPAAIHAARVHAVALLEPGP
jgi:tRNA nucleotidyltransferase (CCA-adding enzyme)